jgi:hypothetical protein
MLKCTRTIQTITILFNNNQKQNTMTNKYKVFNEKFFSKFKKPIKWYDTQGVCEFSDDRVVTFNIDDVGVNGNYNGYWVEIYNKMNGNLIIKKFFRFSNYLTMVHRDSSSETYHVWNRNSEFDWYISRPKDTKEMTDVIFDWIGHF